MRINTHIFHYVVDVVFTLITMLGGMVESSTQTAWRAIMFQLLVMCVILILICPSIVLEIGPTVAASSKMLRCSAPASISIHLVPLKIWFMCTTILCTILLWCTSLIVIMHDPGSRNCAIFVLYTISIVLSSTSRVHLGHSTVTLRWKRLHFNRLNQ